MLQIVTLSYRTPKLITDLHKSIGDHCGKHDYEWVIRDNGLNELETNVEIQQDPKVRIITAENKGNFSSQHNEIMPEITKRKYTLLLNNDIIAISDFIAPMVKILEKDENVGIVGANLNYPNGSLQHAGVIFYEDKTPVNVNTQNTQKLGLYPNLADRDRHFTAVTGACLLVRSELLKAIGFDEKFEWCFDDVDLCLRAYHEFGKNIIYSHRARLIHLENYSLAKNPTDLKPNFPAAFEHLQNKWKHLIQPDHYLYKMNYGIYK